MPIHDEDIELGQQYGPMNYNDDGDNDDTADADIIDPTLTNRSSMPILTLRVMLKALKLKERQMCHKNHEDVDKVSLSISDPNDDRDEPIIVEEVLSDDKDEDDDEDDRRTARLTQYLFTKVMNPTINPAMHPPHPSINPVMHPPHPSIFSCRRHSRI